MNDQLLIQRKQQILSDAALIVQRLGRSQGDSQNQSDIVITEYRDDNTGLNIARTDPGSFSEPDSLDITFKGQVVFVADPGISKTITLFEPGDWEKLVAEKAEQLRKSC